MPRVIAIVIGLFAVASISAAALQVRAHDPDWMVPAANLAKANPLSNRPDVAAGGRKLFEQRCASCHGVDGHGSRKAPNLTSDSVQTQPDGALFWKISSGNTRGGMPGFSFLPEPQRWQLVMHLRNLGGA